MSHLWKIHREYNVVEKEFESQLQYKNANIFGEFRLSLTRFQRNSQTIPQEYCCNLVLNQCVRLTSVIQDF